MFEQPSLRIKGEKVWADSRLAGMWSGDGLIDQALHFLELGTTVGPFPEFLVEEARLHGKLLGWLLGGHQEFKSTSSSLEFQRQEVSCGGKKSYGSSLWRRSPERRHTDGRD